VRATTAEAQANANEAQAKVAAAAEAKERQRAEANEQKANSERDEVRELNKKLQSTQAELRSTLYAAHMNLAQHTWQSGGAERVRELLEQHRPKSGEPDPRGFEWHFLNRLCHQETLTLSEHAGRVMSVTFSPDGARLASISPQDSAVKIWDTQTGRHLQTINGFGNNDPGTASGRLQSITFSPDGKRLAGAYPSFMVRVWDLATGQAVLDFRKDGAGSVGAGYDGRRLAFSPDGRFLATASYSGAVIVWNAQSGEELRTLTGHKGNGTSVAFSSDSKRLASASSDRTVKVWNSETGEELLSLKDEKSESRCVVFSPDGKRLAGTTWGGLKIWDAQSGNEILRITNASYGQASFSPDGKHIAAPSASSTVKVWDVETGEEVLALRGHAQEIWCLAYSPSGKQIASGSADGTVKLWNSQPVENAISLQGASPVQILAISSDGKYVAGAGIPREKVVKVWDGQSGKELFLLEAHAYVVRSLAISPDGTRLAVGSGNRSDPAESGQVKIWNLRSGEELYSFNGGGTCLAFNHDGKLVASGSWNGKVHVWDLNSGKELTSLQAHLRNVTSVAFSPTGNRLATSAYAYGPAVFRAKNEGAKNENGIIVWDAQSGEEIWRHATSGELDYVANVSFSPDGKRLASASADKTIRIFNAETGEELVSLKGHTDSVNRAFFTPDGKRLVSTSRDHTLKLWDAASGQELLSFKDHSSGAAASPDGRRLFAGSIDGIVKMFDATPLPEKP
jgi:WD40 repeat protein